MPEPQTGYLVGPDGLIAAIVHGLLADPPEGMTLVPDPDPRLPIGSPAPAAFAAAVAPTDAQMARVSEDLIAALVTKGALAWGDLPAIARTRVNERRQLRGEAPL